MVRDFGCQERLAWPKFGSLSLPFVLEGPGACEADARYASDRSTGVRRAASDIMGTTGRGYGTSVTVSANGTN
jgi:hypothetical protein